MFCETCGASHMIMLIYIPNRTKLKIYIYTGWSLLLLFPPIHYHVHLLFLPQSFCLWAWTVQTCIHMFCEKHMFYCSSFWICHCPSQLQQPVALLLWFVQMQEQDISDWPCSSTAHKTWCQTWYPVEGVLFLAYVITPFWSIPSEPTTGGALFGFHVNFNLY